ncbi:hypothetical protein BpHYR1_011860 [Brachionus plicatilis]|uniref:SWIM-type domain-containing protein n=1 Tax=Brachionus plicatilis TaxID=10195 RepID=A0A3M7RJV6_BRAPC|nr:hypothetical protein BpHYR1_011860 [Brachionus plicatilis]
MINFLLQQKEWQSFDIMISFLDSIHIVNLNKENWKFSMCSCSYWLKYLHCSHVISCAYRSKLCSFDSIGMNLPIERNKKRGPESETANAYNKQQGENANDDELVLQIIEWAIINNSTRISSLMDKIECRIGSLKSNTNVSKLKICGDLDIYLEKKEHQYLTELFNGNLILFSKKILLLCKNSGDQKIFKIWGKILDS